MVQRKRKGHAELSWHEGQLHGGQAGDLGKEETLKRGKIWRKREAQSIWGKHP